MNKHLHRIVFNAARGMRMVVQETAASTGKGASRATGKRAPATAAVLFGVLVALPGQAQIVASPMVPGGLRPTVLVAPNGVPLVNIQTPSAAGVSRNVYSQFDVMRNGAILNNSRVDVQSQLGGWVQGNPWLAGGPARVILNEINGGNPSQLRGQIEVAGQRAEVVIANPAGILVDGSGFINASRTTLTTGLPQLDAFGGLDSFVVRGGTVRIEGAGLDLTRTDYAAILARAVQVNAGIWANELEVVAGASQSGADHGSVTPATAAGPASGFALDVAALGGMYARKITLIGTEAGLGVRNAGSIGAGAGGLVVTAQGRLENAGTLEGSRIELASSADIGNRGGTIRQTGMAGLTIDSQTLSNTKGGTIGAEPAAPPVAAGSGASVGAAAPGAGTSAPVAGGTVGNAPQGAPQVAPAPGRIGAAGAIQNDGGRIYAGGPVVLKTPQIDNAGGTLDVATMAVTGANFSNAGGTLSVSQGFGANVGQFDNSGGKLNAGTLNIATGGDLINVGGTLGSGGDASLAVGGKADNTRGAIAATGTLNARVTGAIDNSGGTLASNRGLSLTAGSLDNTKGRIQSARAGVQLAVTGRWVDGGGGTIGAATDLKAQAGVLSNAGSLRAENDVSVAVGGAMTNDGSITAGHNTAIAAGSLASGSASVLGAGVQGDGKLGAAGDLRVMVSGALVANGNTIAAGNATLQGASADLSGSQTSAASIAVTATRGPVTTSKATVVTPGTLSFTAEAQPGQTLLNAGGKLNASRLDLRVSNIANTQGGQIVQTGVGATRIATSGAIDNSGGTLASNGSLALVAASLDNKGGTLRAAHASDLTVTTTGLVDNRRGEMSAGGNAAVQAASLDNDAGRISAAGDVSSTTSGESSNQDGTIAANGHTTLNAGSLNNAGGTVSALNTLTAKVQGAVDNTAGTLVADQALVLDAGSLANDKGSVQSTQAATRLKVGGALDNATGYIGAASDLHIKAGSLSNAGTLRGTNDITAAVSDALSNDGSITAGRNTTVTAGRVQGSSTGVLGAGIQGDGRRGATGELSVSASGALAAHGATLAAGNATLQGASVDVSSSQTSAANIAITATQGDVTTSKATVVTPGTLRVTADSNAAQTLVNDAGTLAANRLDLKLSNLANTHGGQIVQTGKGALRIQAPGAIDNSGSVLASNGDLTFVAASLDNKAGALRTGEGASLAIDVNGLLRNSGRGEMASGGSATVRADTFDNEAGRLTAAGDLSSTTHGATGNHGGTIAANGSVVLAAGSLDNSTGTVAGRRRLTANVRGAADNAGGTLIATQSLDVAAASLNNDKGSIQSVEAAARLHVAGALTNTQGYIGAAADLGLQAGSFANTGSVRGDNDATLNVEGQLANDGSITSGRHTTLTAGSVQGGEKSVFGAGIQRDGKPGAAGDLSVKSRGALVARGTNLAAGNALLQGASVDVSRSQTSAANIALAADQGHVVTSHAAVITPGTLAVTADAGPAQTLVNDAGKLDAGRLALKVANLANTGGGEIVQAGTDATAIAMRGTLDNSDGRIASNGNLALAAATLRNREGTVRTAANADLALAVKGLADNAGGDIASGNDLSLRAGTLGNDAGRIAAAGSVSGTVDGAARNKGGTIASNGATRLRAGRLDNSAGTVSGGERVTVEVDGALNNADGTVVTRRALSLKAGSLDNAAGVVRSIQSTAQLDVAGALANDKGRIDAATDLNVTAGSVANTGSLRATQDTTMNVGGQLANDGHITAGRNTTVTAGSVQAGSAGVFGAGVQADGALGTAGALSVRASGALVAQGRHLAAGNAALQGAGVDVSGSQTSAANIALTATRGDVTTSKAAVVTPGTLAITANGQAAQALVNAGGRLNAGQLDLKLSNLANTRGGEVVQVGTGATTIAVSGNLNNDAGRIASNGRDLSLGAGGAMTNAGGRIEHAASDGQGTLALKAGSFGGTGGQITGNGAFVAKVAGSFDQDAATTSARRIAIDAGSLGNRGGQIVQRGADATRIAIVGAIDNSAGTIASNGRLNVAAGSLANRGGAVRAAGASDLELAVASALDNSGKGVIGAGGNGTIAAGRLNNDTGSVTAGGNLRATVGGAATNVSGMLAANGNTTLGADTLDNSRGTVAAVKGDLGVSTKGATTNDAGTLQAAARVSLKNGGLGNIGGKALGDSLIVDTHGAALDNTQGTLAAATTVALNSGALVNDAGLVQSGGAMAIDTNGKALINTQAAGHASKQGGIASADTLDLKAGSIDNAAGFIGAKKALTASTQALSNTKAGLVLGQSTVAIDTHGAAYDNSGGQTMAAGDLRIDAGSLGNAAGLVRSLATTAVVADRIDNHGTQGKDQGIEGQRVAITAASGLNNASGAIRADADATVASGGTVDNTGGLISGGGTVAIADPRAGNPAAKTLNLVNTHGSLVGDQHLKIDAATFSGDGELVAGKDLSIALKQDIVNNAELSARGNLAYITTGNFANHGKLIAGQALTVGGRDVDNVAGAEMSGTDTAVNAGGTLTNRGLIDSNGNTRIDAGAVKNIGTGRIYGNQVSIATSTLDNDAEAANGATKAGTIAARNTLNIGANAIHNREHSLLLSAGAGADAMRIGATLDANRLATGQGSVLDNLSADIESLGGMSVSMANVDNRDVHIERGEPASESSMLVTYAPRYPTVGHSAFYLPEQVRLDPANGQVFLKKPDGTEELAGVGGYGQWTAAVVTTRDTARNIDPARMGAAGDITVSGRLLNQDSQVSAGGTVQAGPYAPEQMQGESTTAIGPAIVINEKGGLEPIVPGQTKKGTVSLGAYKFEPNVNAAKGTKPDAAATAGGTGAANAAGIGSVTTGPGTATIVEVPANVGAVVSVTGQSVGGAGAVAAPQGVAAMRATVSSVVQVDGTSATQSSAGVDRVAAIQGGNAGVAIVKAGAAVHAEAAPGGVPAPRAVEADATRVSTGAAVTPEASTARAGATRTIPMVVRTSSPNTSIPRASLFNIHPEGGSRYVVETDPRFANYRKWLGSEYLLNNLGLDPNTTLKRLGDGFYEQKLIREQVAQLTGYRFLEGFASDDDQYTALMNSGATFARQYGLRPGVALTAAQMAQLTSDIVWLVEQTVTLPDGSTQQALAPQVYVRVQPGDIDGAGALLSADATVIKSKGDVVNTGTIAGRTLVAINAENVKNLGGRIAGGSVGISAREDLENIGGSITARDSAVLTAGRDIRIETTTKTGTQPGTSRTDIDRVAGVYVTDPGGVLIANAGNDVKVIAGVLSNKGADSFTSVTAGRNIELGTVTESQSRLTMLGATGFRGDASSKEVGSTVAGNGTVLLDAKGGSIDARAATIDAGPGVLGLTAANSINIAAGEETASVVERSQVKKKHKLKSTTTTLMGDAASSTSIGSRLSGGSVGVFAGGDIDVVGSDIEARKNATLKAAGNVNIVSAQDSLSASLDTTRTTKGFIAPKLGGASIDRKLATAQHAAVSSQTEAASNIAAGENLNITAGRQVNVYASSLSAGDDLKVAGRQVNVLSGTHASNRELGTSSAKGSIGTMGNFKRAGKGMNGKESVTDSVTQTTLAPATLSGRNVTLTATEGDLTLDAARIHADEQVTLDAAKGQVNMGVVTTSTEVGQSRGESDPMYQRTRETGAHVEAANYTRIDSQTLKVQTPKMNVEMAQHTFNGQSGTPGTQQTIEQLLAMQRDQPGMGWLQQVQNDAALNKLQIDWQAVPLAQRQWAQSQGSLTGAGGAVVAIVATVLTWGAASGIGAAVGGTVGGTTGAVVSAAVSAGVSSIAAQAAVSLINNNGNVGAVLEELTSSQGIKGIVSAMGTAGALQGLNIGLGISDYTAANIGRTLPDGTTVGWQQVLQRNLINSVSGGIVNSAIQGTSVEQGIKSGLLNGLLNTAASGSAHWIGANGPDGEQNLNALASEVAHAIAGCLVGAGRASAGSGGGMSSGGGCSVGAVGAVVGHLTGQIYNPNADPQYAERTIQLGQMVAGIAGALVGGTQGAADIASGAGANAVENNWLSGKQRASARAATTPREADTWIAKDAAQQRIFDDLAAATSEYSQAQTPQARAAAGIKLDQAQADASALSNALKAEADGAGVTTVNRAIAQADNARRQANVQAGCDAAPATCITTGPGLRQFGIGTVKGGPNSVIDLLNVGPLVVNGWGYIFDAATGQPVRPSVASIPYPSYTQPEGRLQEMGNSLGSFVTGTAILGGAGAVLDAGAARVGTSGAGAGGETTQAVSKLPVAVDGTASSAYGSGGMKYGNVTVTDAAGNPPPTASTLRLRSLAEPSVPNLVLEGKANAELLAAINGLGSKSSARGASVMVGAYDLKSGLTSIGSSGALKANELSPIMVKFIEDKLGVPVGETTNFCLNLAGFCAEVKAADNLIRQGVDPSNIKFTHPVRPGLVYGNTSIPERALVPGCANCTTTWPYGYRK